MVESGAKEPQQERSRRTLDKILTATEDLLTSRHFERITIQEIVRKARTSVGAFYARFANKEALLPALYERYDATIPRLIERPLPPAQNLDERCRHIVERMLQAFTSRKGLLRAMCLHARLHPELIPAAAREQRTRMHATIREHVLEFRAEIAHHDPQLAADLGLFMVSATMRDKLLFGDAPHAASFQEIEPDQIAHELTRALVCYLRGAPAA